MTSSGWWTIDAQQMNTNDGEKAQSSGHGEQGKNNQDNNNNHDNLIHFQISNPD
jgi:hypothetical protein